MQEAQVCRAIILAHPLHPCASFVFSFIESNAALTTAGAEKVHFLNDGNEFLINWEKSAIIIFFNSQNYTIFSIKFVCFTLIKIRCLMKKV